MKSQTDQTAVEVREANEFCVLTHSLDGVEFASSMKYRWYWDDEKRQAWLAVEKICESFLYAESLTTSGRYPIPMISDILGPSVGLKLYRYYLSQCEAYQLRAKGLVTVNEFAHMIQGTHLNSEEGRKLYTLTRQLMESE